MKQRFFRILPLTLAILTPTVAVGYAQEEEKVGRRPYEMEWAGRTEEVGAQLVDFENLDGWRVETKNTIATFERSREEQMYGQYVGKLTYRCEDPAGEAPEIILRPSSPIPVVEKDADMLSLWGVGNNWGWTTDPTTPRAHMRILFTSASGKELELPLTTINWKEWHLCYSVLRDDIRALLPEGLAFSGIRIVDGTNKEDRTLYFDSLRVFKEERAPLEFSRRPRPGIELFEGQPLGVNTGDERLPFPTTEDTIVPDSSKNLVKPAFHFYGDGCDFVYEGTDGVLVYDYRPRSGKWTDISARWNDAAPFRPCVDGGVTNLVGASGAAEPVETSELLKFEATDEGAKSIWRLASKTATAQVEYRFQMKGKSLVIDTLAKGGVVQTVDFGRVDELGKARVFTSPYYLYDYARRPAFGLLTTKDSKETLFAGAHIDWYRSGASYLRGDCGVNGLTATLNGGALYNPKTDGTRNDVYERFVLTFSPKFEEVLPTIANPASPYRDVAGKGVWRAHGATTRENDKKYWSDVYRRGMRHMIVCDHETCWRDGGESFTFRSKPAPGKGGDEGWIDYSRFMQDKLGFVYGPYNNFTDFAPVNEYWSPDMVSRANDWSLQRAWMRCYAPKPIRAVEYCEKLTPIIEEKFQFSTAYCDVHSSVPPWTRTDYDERVPGAGTFMSVYYPFGEIFLLQKKNWGGPTYSEGPHHCFYAGLVDGNYAQDQPYNMFLNPWFVDFDLRKMHDLEVDFGMGNVGMFAPRYEPSAPEEQSDLIDRFIAATLAFGHSGFYVAEYGVPIAGRSYFMTQQIASYYTQTSADTIRYFDANGDGYETSEALKRDLVKRSQVCVVYQDGTTVVANGSRTDGMIAKLGDRVVELPPNGYAAWSGDGKVLVESFLSDFQRRFDYCESPEYIWLDARGTWVERNLACGTGAGVCRALETPGEYEVVPYDDGELGFRVAQESDSVVAIALDKEYHELGEARVKRSRGFVFIDRVDGAFSYKLVVKPTEDGAKVQEWRASKFVVESGESIVFTKGNESVEWVAPPRANDVEPAKYVQKRFGVAGEKYWIDAAGAIRHYWAEPVPGEFADALVVEAERRAFRTDDDGKLFSRDAYALSGETSDALVVVDPESPTRIGAETIRVEVDGVPFMIGFDVKEAYRRYPYDFEDPLNAPSVWIQRRGEAPTTNIEGTGAHSYISTVGCGGDSRVARRLHPPYLGGGGRTALQYELTVPADAPVVFRMNCGKVDGSDSGDGILYQVAVRRAGEDQETTLAERLVTEHRWTPIEADLSDYAGETITLLIVVDMNENTLGDWACCSAPRLEAKTPFLRREITSVEKVKP